MLAVISQSAHSPTVTTNYNVLIAISMILQRRNNSTLDNRLHLKVMEDTNSLLTKLREIVLLNSKTNFQTIRLICVCRIKQIQGWNTTIINSSNISMLHTIVIRTSGKTLGISKRTFTSKTKTAHKIIAIILVTSTIGGIQTFHILLTKTSTIITHGKRRISRCWQDHLKGILITSTNVTVISISRQFTNSRHYFVRVKRV